MASAGTLEPTRAALIVLRALAYDKQLVGRVGATFDFVVLAAPTTASAEDARRVAAAFEALRHLRLSGLPIRVAVVTYDGSPEAARSVAEARPDALFVCRGHEARLADIAALAARTGALGIGRSRAEAAAGLGLAVDEIDGKPVIFVNLRASQAQGAAFSIELLRLAEVIR